MLGILTIKSQKHGVLEFTSAINKDNKVKYLFCNGKQLFNNIPGCREAILVTYRTFEQTVNAYHKKRLATIRGTNLKY